MNAVRALLLAAFALEASAQPKAVRVTVPRVTSLSMPGAAARAALANGAPAASAPFAPMPLLPAPAPGLSAAADAELPASPAAAAAAESAPAPADSPENATFDAEGVEAKFAAVRDAARLAGASSEQASSLAASLFDGGSGRASPLGADAPSPKSPLPPGAVSARAVRARSSPGVREVVPFNAATRPFLDRLANAWKRIGWLDLKTYGDKKGGSFHSIDLTGRAELIESLPGVSNDEAALMRRIKLHSKSLELMIIEEGKTPDLVVDGVVTEMKAAYAVDGVYRQLVAANEQMLAHGERHGLESGAVAVLLVGQDSVPARAIQKQLDMLVETEALALRRVEVYAGLERKVFELDASRRFGLVRNKKAKPVPVEGLTTAVQFARDEAQEQEKLERDVWKEFDPALVVRELMEPVRRLKAAGVRGTVAFYGSARLLSPERAEAELRAAEDLYGKRPRSSRGRRAVANARRAMKDSKYYRIMRELAGLAVTESGKELAVVVGGGPSLMEAANRGALEAGGVSVGYNIKLPFEQSANPYITEGFQFDFEYFPTRKIAMRYGAIAHVFGPGGFGTFDELFELLTLMQTGKIPKTPIVLIGGKDYWDKVVDFEEFVRRGVISADDLELFRFASNARAGWKAISRPLRKPGA